MIFKNSIKLLMSNFITVWKIFLYKLIVVGITVGLFCTTLGYLNQIPQFNSFLDSILNFLTTTTFASTPFNIMTTLFLLFQDLLNIIVEIFILSPFVFFFLIFLVFFLFPYLWHLSDLAVSENLFGFMASQTKYGFTGSLIRNLRAENSFSWVYSLTLLPFNLAFIAGGVGFLYLTQIGGLLELFLPFIALLYILVYFSLRITIFSGWASAIATTNCGTFRGLSLGIGATKRKFMRVWSTSIIYVFSFMLIIMITGLFGLIILLPILCMLIATFGMVMFFENKGMRYYVDMETIREPKKLEQTDNIKKLKFII